MVELRVNSLGGPARVSTQTKYTGYCKRYGVSKCITSGTIIQTDVPIIRSTLMHEHRLSAGHCPENTAAYGSICFVRGIPQDVIDRVETEFDLKFADNDEGFIIDAADDIRIYSNTDRGLFYGCMELLRLVKDGSLECMLVYDYPFCPDRGLKVYLPSERNIGYFKQFVDLICRYKYNTIMIEVGGAMEYKRHPEINAGWVEYCAEMYEYSGKANEIQDGYGWRKNSIHAENGEGGYLSQERVRELVKYCKERFLRVIPEVPCLSHSDYLLFGEHRALAERQDDPYPDTYCPSNPGSYALLFDILDEVIDVFDPDMINIGHDEYYSIGVCDKCKGKSGEEIFASDVIKIHARLASKGIRTMIWSDKTIKDAYHKWYGFFGGAEQRRVDEATGEEVVAIPATYKSIDMLPADVKHLHWLWDWSDKDGNMLDTQFTDRKLDAVFGNFVGYEFVNWRDRVQAGFTGAIISNWSTLGELVLQRNGILFNVVFSYYMLWGRDYDDDKYEHVRNAALAELYRYRSEVLVAEPDSDSDSHEIKLLEITHTTDRNTKHRSFVDGVFVDPEVDHLGDYIVDYADGTSVRIPIVYGENIGPRDASWDVVPGDPPYKYRVDERLAETSYRTLPIKDGGYTYYRFIWRNPYPSKQIQSISVKARTEGSDSVWVTSVRFV